MVLVAALLLASLPGCAVLEVPRRSSSGPNAVQSRHIAGFLKGMSYAGYAPDVYLSPESDREVRHIAATGANNLVVIPQWYQDDRTSTSIAPWSKKTPSDASVVHVIRLAHALKMGVTLKPFDDAKDNTWRALYQPRDWAAWFRSYTAFIVHYARIAQREHVDMFSVGCEYTSSDATHGAEWRKVIAAVRKVYHGPLTYAADWPAYSRVAFWNAVDYVGIDAYFPLSRKTRPTLGELEAAWRGWERQIADWRKSAGIRKGVIFTEIGYTSRVGTARDPAAYAYRAPVDLRTQQLAYEATFRTVYQAPWLAGILWFWWDNPSVPDYPGGPADVGYTPHGKPAEAVLRNWFAKPRALAQGIR